MSLGSFYSCRYIYIIKGRITKSITRILVNGGLLKEDGGSDGRVRSEEGRGDTNYSLLFDSWFISKSSSDAMEYFVDEIIGLEERNTFLKIIPSIS